MYERTVLANGLRVVSSTMPHTRSVSVGLYVGAGSRYETDEIAGVSHFLEHMLFKGTRRRPTAQQISEEIEGIGGVMNAATDKELTVYWAKVGHQHFTRCLDVLADALRNSLFEPGEIEKERQVILEELAMTEDSPGDLAALLIDEVLWPAQPLGRDVGGSPASVTAMDRGQILEYVARHYLPENTVLAVAGNVTHDEVARLADAHLGDWERGPFGTWHRVLDTPSPRVAIKSKKSEQAHVCLAMPAYSSAHPDRYALDVLNTILGEGMSSRLFVEIREKLALAYDVQSYLSHFRDAGSLTVSAGVDPKRIEPTIEAAVRELQRICEPVPQSELRKAKEFIKGRLQLRMEDTRAVASWLGGQELLRDEILTVDEILEQIERVSVDDLCRVAEDVIRPARMSVAVVGPYRSEARFAKLLPN
ncbi:MAG: insulinase family protein [Chloroflexi bacterium]|nr:insulinase family protein [Chloroflexota bacterium]